MILTREALEHAITKIHGSWWFYYHSSLASATLFMPQMLTCHSEDFNTIQERVPPFTETFSQYVFQDLYEARWCPCGREVLSWQWFPSWEIVSHVLQDSVAENLADFADLTPGQKVITPLTPKRADGPLIILNGNLALMVRLPRYQVPKSSRWTG